MQSEFLGINRRSCLLECRECPPMFLLAQTTQPSYKVSPHIPGPALCSLPLLSLTRHLLVKSTRVITKTLGECYFPRVKNRFQISDDDNKVWS